MNEIFVIDQCSRQSKVSSTFLQTRDHHQPSSPCKLRLSIRYFITLAGFWRQVSFFFCEIIGNQSTVFKVLDTDGMLISPVCRFCLKTLLPANPRPLANLCSSVKSRTIARRQEKTILVFSVIHLLSSKCIPSTELGKFHVEMSQLFNFITSIHTSLWAVVFIESFATLDVTW